MVIATLTLIQNFLIVSSKVEMSQVVVVVVSNTGYDVLFFSVAWVIIG